MGDSQDDLGAPSAPRFAPPVQLMSPEATPVTGGWDEGPVFRVMLIGDLSGEQDERPLGDRRSVTMSPEGMNATLSLDHLRRDLGVKWASRAALADAPPHVRALWHAAEWLGCHPARTEIANVTAAELLAEAQDAPTLSCSSVRYFFQRMNHPAMEARQLLVLGFELDPLADQELCEHLGRLAERHAIPVLIPLAASFSLDQPEPAAVTAMRRCSWARWVTFVAGGMDCGNGVVPHALLVVQQAARRFFAPSGLWGQLPAPHGPCVTPLVSKLAWQRGILALARASAGPMIVDDATFTSELGTRRSLSWLLLAQRFTREARLSQLLLAWQEVPGGMGAQSMAAILHAEVMRRLPPAPGLAVSFDNPVWEEAPEDMDHIQAEGTLALTLRLSAATIDGELVTHEERVAWRFSPG